jgi:TusA-related sulfurtransferase
MAEALNAIEEMPRMASTRRLDLRGQTCPTTSDETLRVLGEMTRGEVLEVVSDYYPARSTIPYHCDKRGYRYAFADAGPGGAIHPESDPRTWVIRIQKT